jgi:formate dehydrogenase subunit gamma
MPCTVCCSHRSEDSPTVTESSVAKRGATTAAGRILRHAAADRVFHWLSAGCVLILLATAFLPILGIEFDWVTVHWVTGLVLIAAVLFHLVRAVFWQGLRPIWLGTEDLRDGLAIARWALRRDGTALPKSGKYSFAQKAIHHAFAAVVLTAAISGSLMLVRIDTPWWQRNPYLLGDGTWGLVYVLHDLAALSLITMVMMHVYFAFRPEKRLFLRAMIRGWITREEYRNQHDPERWQVDR